MSLWIEKYRPTKLDNYVCSEETKDLIRAFLSNNNCPNMLLAGPPGIGKTSLAKLLANSIEDLPVLYINAAEESGIDTVRNRIKDFVETQGFGTIKMVILDEADGLTRQAQDALKNVIEISTSARFILTCNTPTKIIDALKSRCPLINISFETTDVLRHIVKILKAEAIEIKKEDHSRIRSLVDECYPDIRKTVNIFQRACESGKFNPNVETSKVIDAFLLEFTNEITKELSENDILTASNNLRKFYYSKASHFNADYISLSTKLFNWMLDNKPLTTDQVLVLNEFIYKVQLAIDKEIIFYGFILKSLQIIGR